jgi:myosin heavy subunit
MGKGSDSDFHNGLTRSLASAAPVVAFPPKMHESFVLQHYAGEVAYRCQGFVERNKDTISNGGGPAEPVTT